jgi:hypothetical protein
MKVFDFDIKKWVILMLPTFLRGKVMVAFLQVLCKPIESLYTQLLSSRNSNLYELKHTGQVCYLRKVLNDKFNVDSFQIEDISILGEWLIVYDETEHLSDEHVVVSEEEPAIVYDESLLTVVQGSFVIYVPSEVCTNIDIDKEKMPIIRALVEKYRLTSRLPIYKSKQ